MGQWTWLVSWSYVAWYWTCRGCVWRWTDWGLVPWRGLAAAAGVEDCVGGSKDMGGKSGLDVEQRPAGRVMGLDGRVAVGGA